MNLISKKKKVYPLQNELRKYLIKYGREKKVPLSYHDLKNYDECIPLLDSEGKDTLWIQVLYRPGIMQEIHEGLKKIYSILKAGGDLSVMKHLRIDRVDLCLYANTAPFRIRVVNMLNENFDYFYVKLADASRVYGLELEHLLSPNKVDYLVHQDTLIEEHIIGIPADVFLKKNLNGRHFEETRIAKEFVKFNERCFVRLLGDMHAGNFVIAITQDFEEVHYRMRSIDFDQQSYEKRKSVYLPQYFKQNKMLVELVQRNLTLESIHQYQSEERALIMHRIRNSRYQIKDLLDEMMKENLSPPEHIENLAQELAKHYNHPDFIKCKSMGALVRTSLRVLIKKTAHQNLTQNSK